MPRKLGLQFGVVPGPVEHVGAGYMDKGKRVLLPPRMLQDVVHLIQGVEGWSVRISRVPKITALGQSD